MSAAAQFPWRPRDSGIDLRVLFANSPIGLAEVERTGMVAILNPALARMLGDRWKMARAIPFADLIPERDRAAGRRQLQELFDGKRDSFQIETRMEQTAAGAPHRSLCWRIWRVSGSNGRPDYALAFAEEEAVELGSEPRLLQVEQLESIGRLASGVAHDFNNLLTGVLLYCDLLVANSEQEHLVCRYANEIRAAGLQASGLVRQLLQVARPGSCEVRLLSLNDIVEDMRNLLTRLIGENIELTLCLDRSLGLVKMNATQARQVLLNLVLNARDALADGGKITVATSNCRVQVLAPSGPEGVAASLPCALFAVEDNGRGIDAETRAHIFDAFFSTKAAKGTGLGLATVHDIVAGHGGLIHVASQPGQGTRISLLLPLAAEQVPGGKGTNDSKPNEGEPSPLKEDHTP
jgi:two-component system, cell cycle sensor histidine kinase and response regulator CckA